MAFVSQGRNGLKVSTDAAVALADTTTTYSGRFPSSAKPDLSRATRYVVIGCNATAVTGTNLDVSLYGSDTLGGAVKFSLLDAVVADLTATGWVWSVPIDLNAYPAPYYYIGFLSDVDEVANTVAVRLIS